MPERTDEKTSESALATRDDSRPFGFSGQDAPQCDSLETAGFRGARVAVRHDDERADPREWYSRHNCARKGSFMPARRREPRVLAREEPAELQVAATNGSILTDSRGRKYIDFVMGWCVGNFGWREGMRT